VELGQHKKKETGGERHEQHREQQKIKLRTEHQSSVLLSVGNGLHSALICRNGDSASVFEVNVPHTSLGGYPCWPTRLNHVYTLLIHNMERLKSGSGYP